MMTGTDSTHHNKQERFLVSLAEGHSVTHAAKAIGIGRRTAYNWRGDDLEFAQAWDEALESGSDCFEDMLYDSAKSGNVTAIIVGLKMRGRFIERQFVHLSHGELKDQLRNLAPELSEEELEIAASEAMKLLAAPRSR